MNDRKQAATRIGRLLENPGRILFIRGGATLEPSDPDMPDSFSPEYYYLLQQKARLQLINAIPMGRTFNPLRIARWLALSLAGYVRLKMVNALVDSYVNESRLVELSREQADAPRRDPQAR